MNRPTDIYERDILEPVLLPDWPPFLPQFADFIRLNRLSAAAGGGIIVRCNFCNLAMAMADDYNPSTEWRPLMFLAEHGLRHAIAGDLTAVDAPP